MPIPAKTTRNSAPSTVAFAAIWIASSRWGSPPIEKIGSFWPRTSVASPSIAETPVRTASRGTSRRAGLIGVPATARRCEPVTGGPPSIGTPRPLLTRPSQRSVTGICSGAPLNATTVARRPDPRGALEHLDDGEVGVDVDDHAVSDLAVGQSDLDGLVPSDTVGVADEQQRSVDAVDRP
jgi:hypothetical protein